MPRRYTFVLSSAYNSCYLLAGFPISVLASPSVRMKSLFAIVLCAFFLLPALSVSAQEAAPAFKAEALTATRQLAALISLDDARQLPVRRLTQLRLTQEAEVAQLYANDPDMLRKKRTAIGQEYTQQLSQVLTAAQYQRYMSAAAGVLPASVAAVPAPSTEPALPVAAAPAQRTVPMGHSTSQLSNRGDKPTPTPRPVTDKAAVRR